MTPTQISRRALLAGLAVGTLAGCSQATTGRWTNWARGGKIAGSDVDEGGFGNPTAYNTAIQTGEIQARSELGERFAATVPTTVNFAFNSARLSGQAHQIIKRQADFMRQFPEVRFSVFGHADAPGSNSYNDRLGRRRAEAVVNALSRAGVSRSRVDALISKGENQPLVPSAGREAANRRAVTEVAGFVSDHPLVLDGNYGAIVYRRYAFGG